MHSADDFFQWVEATRERLRKPPSYRKVAEHIGVSHGWVAAFVKGSIKNPPADKVQAVNDFLDQVNERKI